MRRDSLVPTGIESGNRVKRHLNDDHQHSTVVPDDRSKCKRPTGAFLIVATKRARFFRMFRPMGSYRLAQLSHEWSSCVRSVLALMS